MAPFLCMVPDISFQEPGKKPVETDIPGIGIKRFFKHPLEAFLKLVGHGKTKPPGNDFHGLLPEEPVKVLDRDPPFVPG